MIRAGSLDRQVQLQSFAGLTNGDPLNGTWTTEATVWAKRMSPTGMERVAGGMVATAEATQAYEIRYRSDLVPTPVWRLLDGSEIWNIVAVLPEGRDVGRVLLVRRFNPNDTT